MPFRQVSLRDRDETREARLGSKQIITVRIETPVRNPETNRQKLSCRIEQEPEYGGVKQFHRALAESGKTSLEQPSGAPGTLERLDQHVDLAKPVGGVVRPGRKLVAVGCQYADGCIAMFR